MQALDLLHRRLWQDRSAGLDAFLVMARSDLAGREDARAATVDAIRNAKNLPKTAQPA